MRVWRLSQHPDWDGKGALLASGRWHRRGTPVVYTSGTLSLALLELFVNLDPSTAPAELLMRAGEIPDTMAIERVQPRSLPADWRKHPAPTALAERGTAWARDGTSAVLAVPSAIVPQEWNYLLNPLHPDFGSIRLLPPAPFEIDPRMWKP
jgi:RES domain-containing protein